ncbi:enoyl-CoA hydratase/isomerase family protein [Streptomyces sp. NPDC050485]|uniref:enoyl-CoA hydratase/isomerase family protein n=1 Tax=Streptomyces sp. NPDC050485 TaxID=3365617 RepID=UPI003790327B
MSILVARDKETGVAIVTLNRPERLNAVDLGMASQLSCVWRELRCDDSVRAIVVTGAGERAFCTGIDRSAEVPQPSSPYSTDDPLLAIGPKANDLWKPVIAAVRGMACGGAFYLLGEAEFVVAAEDATFFDPHTTYGMVSAYESMYLALRMPYGEVARLALLGTAERMSARRAYEVGFVSELTAPGGELMAAVRCAETIAGYPTGAVQGTVRSVWAAKEGALARAVTLAPHLVSLGSLSPERQAELFAERRSKDFRVR